MPEALKDAMAEPRRLSISSSRRCFRTESEGARHTVGRLYGEHARYRNSLRVSTQMFDHVLHSLYAGGRSIHRNEDPRAWATPAHRACRGERRARTLRVVTVECYEDEKSDRPADCANEEPTEGIPSPTAGAIRPKALQ